MDAHPPMSKTRFRDIGSFSRVYTVSTPSRSRGMSGVDPKQQMVFRSGRGRRQDCEQLRPTIRDDQPRIALSTVGRRTLHLPQSKLSRTRAAIIGTALHELCPLTGHPSRLDRTTLQRDDRSAISPTTKEGLRAELASVFLAQSGESRTIPSSTAARMWARGSTF